MSRWVKLLWIECEFVIDEFVVLRMGEEGCKRMRLWIGKWGNGGNKGRRSFLFYAWLIEYVGK